MGPDTGGGTLPAAQQPWPGGRPAGRYLHAEHCQTGQGIQVLKFSDLVFPQEQTLQAGQGVDVLNGLWEGQGSGEPPEADWPQRAGSSCLGVSPALLGRHIPLGRLSREPSLERGGKEARRVHGHTHGLPALGSSQGSGALGNKQSENPEWGDSSSPSDF